MNRCIKSLFFVFLLLFLPTLLPANITFAEDGERSDVYLVYDEYGNFLMEKSSVQENDVFLASDFSEWRIIQVDGYYAIAIKEKNLDKPLVSLKKSVTQKEENKKVCLYLTHNDESYIPSDGYYTIYGKGGVHDVAKCIKSKLEEKNIDVTLDENLHIPHNSTAYTRSKVTAQKLQALEPDGLFDIHRDATQRDIYYSTCNGKEISKIRIVVGSSNPNFENNYKFAQKVFAVGQAMYPGLFLDIYLGKGNYNQSLQEHALLFEMGCHNIEKELVLNSVPMLSNVLDTVLYSCKNDTQGNIEIDENHIKEIDSSNQNNNEEFDENDKNLPKNEQKSAKNGFFLIILPIFIVLVAIISITNFIKKKTKK